MEGKIFNISKSYDNGVYNGVALIRFMMGRTGYKKDTFLQWNVVKHNSFRCSIRHAKMFELSN